MPDQQQTPTAPTGGTTTAAPPAAAPAGKPDTTRYLVLVEGEDKSLRRVGAYTVKQGRLDLAYKEALAALHKQDPEATKFDLHACPMSKWNSETFELEPPAEPQFKPKSASS